MAATLTPSQTIGPFFHIALDWPNANRLSNDMTPGEQVIVQGQVVDGDGTPVRDGLLEIWQADAGGQYHHGRDADFRGAGRCVLDEDGRYVFATIKPGAIDELAQAPHINVALFARGLLVHLYTRIYFEDEADANERDTVLACVAVERRHTLIARREGAHYFLNIQLQGAQETVFFNV